MKLKSKLNEKTFYSWSAMSAVFFYGGITPLHSHNTLQLVFDIKGRFRCRTRNSEWALYKSILIKANVAHQLDTNGSVQLIVYLDASSELARTLCSRYRSADIDSLDLDILDCVKAGELEKCLVKQDASLLNSIIQRLFQKLNASKTALVRDDRIDKVLLALSGDCSENSTISMLARHACLSESRLRSLFKNVTGVPLHRYIIWNRLMIAIRKIMNGASIMDAAMESGFTDGSHLHKLMVTMFGLSPSQFVHSNATKRMLLLAPEIIDLQSTVHS